MSKSNGFPWEIRRPACNDAIAATRVAWEVIWQNSKWLELVLSHTGYASAQRANRIARLLLSLAFSQQHHLSLHCASKCCSPYLPSSNPLLPSRPSNESLVPALDHAPVMTPHPDQSPVQGERDPAWCPCSGDQGSEHRVESQPITHQSKGDTVRTHRSHQNGPMLCR